jgi:hypothetical protein
MGHGCAAERQPDRWQQPKWRILRSGRGCPLLPPLRRNFGPAHAVPPGQYNGYGAGTQSCGQWLASRLHGQEVLPHQSDANPNNLSWVLGWLSAAGYYLPSALRDTDPDAVAAWVDNYCREHPLEKLQVAAASLVDELSKTK